jgi:diaminopimelate decarboxylase
MAEVCARHGMIPTELNIVGEQGIPYVPGDPALDLDALRDFVDDALDASCAAERFPRPTIVVEPGRAISARAGITLYRVLWVQSQPGGSAIVVVDGGLSDSPRRCGVDGSRAAVKRFSTASDLHSVSVVTVGGVWCCPRCHRHSR